MRCLEGYMSAKGALCCWGRGGAVQGPVDRGAFPCRVVTGRYSGHLGGSPRRLGARV